jgi:ActR/RegA family two-component response regulator
MNETTARFRVLVVDDQPNWRELLRELLEPEYVVETAASYDEAKGALRQRAFHAVVSDQRLVDVDAENIQGILLLDDVKALHDGTQVIIVTGYPTIKAAKAALRRHDAFDYLLKNPEEGGPFDHIGYIDLVRAATEKAAHIRQKFITLEFSLPDTVSHLTYAGMAGCLFPETPTSYESEENTSKLLKRLLYSFQPLARHMGKNWLTIAPRLCDILVWSRDRDRAVLSRLAQEEGVFSHHPIGWLKEKWQLVEHDQFVLDRLVGISYVVESMTFDEFALLVEG